MRMLRLILERSRSMLALVLVASLLSGGFNAGVIAVTNRAMHDATAHLAMIFAALVAGRLISNLLAQATLARFTQHLISDQTCDLVDTVLRVPLRALEHLGTARLLATLTADVDDLADGLRSIPTLAYNSALLMGGAVYLAFLSWPLLLGFTGLAVMGALGYRAMLGAAFRTLVKGRAEKDRLFEHFHALLEGTKELKLNRARRRTFVSEGVRPASERRRDLHVAADVQLNVAQAWCHLLLLAMIGVTLFAWGPARQLPPETVTGYVLATLFLMGPLTALMGSFSYLGRAAVALGRLESVQAQMSSLPSDLGVGTLAAFQRLELRGVTHSYWSERDDRHFELGPVDLTLEPGEIVFVVGGNGSGKSTLGKVLTGLYPPERGEIVVDGRPIDDASRDGYRQLFSALFSDFHLFDTLVGVGGIDLDTRARLGLKRLQLEHKVSISEGRFSTTALSQGQRKRLALLSAWLEERPLCLFDEWAADQDPAFKHIFYHELLPDLARRGRAVVAITHDDRYFHLADRVIRLDEGRVISDTRWRGHAAGTSDVALYAARPADTPSSARARETGPPEASD